MFQSKNNVLAMLRILIFMKIWLYIHDFFVRTKLEKSQPCLYCEVNPSRYTYCSVPTMCQPYQVHILFCTYIVSILPGTHTVLFCTYIMSALSGTHTILYLHCVNPTKYTYCSVPTLCQPYQVHIPYCSVPTLCQPYQVRILFCTYIVSTLPGTHTVDYCRVGHPFFSKECGVLCILFRSL